VRGFRQEKWFELPGLLNSHRVAILGVQEAHLTENLAGTIKTAFGARLKLFYSPLPGTDNAAGVAILLNKGLVNTERASADVLVPDRAILVTLPWHAGEPLKVLCVYAPNDSGVNATFWETLNNLLATAPHLRPDIMLGDFNLVEDSIDRLPCHHDDATPVAALGELKCNAGLVDGWRRTHPDRWEYTPQHAPNTSQGRIDRIYITNELLPLATDWKIDSTVLETDHWLASVRVSTPVALHIGRGRWQIPLYVLADEGVCKRINDLGKGMECEIQVNKYRRSSAVNPQTIFARFKSEVVSMCRDREKRARPTITNKIDKLKRRLDSVNNDPLNSEENNTGGEG
jgi:exonuclease III